MKYPRRNSSQNRIIMPYPNNYVIGPPIDTSPASMLKSTSRKKILAAPFHDVKNHIDSSYHNDFVVDPPSPPMASHYHNDFVVGPPPPPPMDDDDDETAPLPPPPSMRNSRKKLYDEDTTNTSNKRRKRTRKSVNWGSIECYASSVTQNDVNRMWYNEHELKVFKEDRKRVVRAIKNVRGDLSALDGTEFVTRGFECYQSIKFNKTIREQRKVVIESVLRTQHKQRLCCEHDPEEIAVMCRRRSSWARSWATDLGMKDSSFIFAQEEEEEKTPELVRE